MCALKKIIFSIHGREIQPDAIPDFYAITKKRAHCARKIHAPNITAALFYPDTATGAIHLACAFSTINIRVGKIYASLYQS